MRWAKQASGNMWEGGGKVGGTAPSAAEYADGRLKAEKRRYLDRDVERRVQEHLHHGRAL